MPDSRPTTTVTVTKVEVTYDDQGREIREEGTVEMPWSEFVSVCRDVLKMADRQARNATEASDHD